MRNSSSSSLFLGNKGSWPFYFLPVQLRGEELEKHKWIMGTTGKGKSKFIAHLATTLLYTHHQPIAVIDPHGDLARDILWLLLSKGYFNRSDAFDKLWYVDFSRTDCFVPFNVLHQPHYLPHTTVRNVIKAVMRAFPNMAEGAAPQFENIMQYGLMVLYYNKLPLTCLTQVLTDREYREELLCNVPHPKTQEFFHRRFDRWKAADQAQHIESSVNKIDIFTFHPCIEHSLGQHDNLLNFRHLLDKGISVIFNLSGASMDEDTQNLLGCLIMVGFEQALLSRADLREEERSRCHIFIDEFQKFLARDPGSVQTFLSESRKYGATLWLANQNLSQVPEGIRGALGNALPIAFGLSRPDAVVAAEVFARYDPYRVKHTVSDAQAQERTHPTFWSLTEQFEAMASAIADLRRREAVIKLQRFWRASKQTVQFRTPTIPTMSIPYEYLLQVQEQYANLLHRPPPQPPQETTDAYTAAAIPKRTRLGYL